MKRSVHQLYTLIIFWGTVGCKWDKGIIGTLTGLEKKIKYMQNTQNVSRDIETAHSIILSNHKTFFFPFKVLPLQKITFYTVY